MALARRALSAYTNSLHHYRNSRIQLGTLCHMSGIATLFNKKERAMKFKRHGLSVGIERVDDHFFMSLKVRGKLTHEDYEVIIPMIDSALAGVKEPRVKALLDATELEGWEARAAWDDFKLGLKHGNEFEKIAIYGNKKWQHIIASIGNWFISGEVRFFEDESSAITWINK